MLTEKVNLGCLECDTPIFYGDDGYEDCLCKRCFLNYQLDLERGW
jgi:hypothetical protein